MIKTQVLLKDFKLCDLDKKETNRALRKLGNSLVKKAKGKLSQKRVSKAGEYAGMRTGDLRRAVKLKSSKNTSKSVWVKLQIDTIYSKDKGTNKRVKKDWYAGPLNYGRHSGDLRARRNPITDTAEENAKEFYSDMEDVLINSIG